MGILSTVSSDGTPWGSAVYFVVDNDFKFYFVTRTGTLKFENVEANPKAALTIADSASQVTVQLTGTVSRVPVKEYFDVIFDKLGDIRPEGDNSWSPPIAKVHEGNYMPLCLTPVKLQYADYGHRKPDSPHHDYIEQIIG